MLYILSKTKMDEYVTLFLEAEEKENERHPPFHESVEDVQSLMMGITLSPNCHPLDDSNGTVEGRFNLTRSTLPGCSKNITRQRGC